MTAIREAEPLGRRMQPLTLCAYEIDAEPIFDALQKDQRDAYRVSDSDLVCPTWEAEMLAGSIPKSQALAERLITAGYVGMRAPSLAIGASINDLNLVMWRWGRAQPTRVVLIDGEGRLPAFPR